MFEDNKITYFAETDYRNQKTKFGIKAKDRSKHMYVIGKTGMGKSTLLENMAIQDIQNDEGLIFIDPHGSTAVKLLEYIPKHRIDDVVYFAPHDTDFPIAFNVLEQVPREKRNAVAGGLISTFKKIWVDSFSSRMEYLLNYTLLALLDVPGSTLLGVNRLLSDKVYRKYIVDRVEDTLVKNFWNQEFERYTTTYASEAVAPIQNKVGQFIASPMIRNIIGQEVSTIDFRSFMDQKKIVIINISKGIIGPENMRLLGGMLITKIQLAAMSRANLSEEALRRTPNTYLYVDEFQNFANESFAEILSESRKYKLCLTVANQYIDQMTEEVRNAVIGNVGTFISFRVGSTDAELMEKEFSPNFVADDMVNLGIYQMYLKLMIDGIGSKPFSANSLPPIPKPAKSYIEEIVGFSRKYYSGEKENVEANIKKWSNRDFNLDMQQAQAVQNKEKKPSEKNGDRKPQEERRQGDRRQADKKVTPPPQVIQDTKEKEVAKEIERIIKEVEKQEKKEIKKEENLRKKVLSKLQQTHAFQTNKVRMTSAPKKSDLDEVPEDVLKALLDLRDL
jgi:energy-coupling factor transporter ATP-binding protein EcfA2